MKYYSEITKELYDTPEALATAEADIIERKSQQAADKKHLDEVHEARLEANRLYFELLQDYCKKYGYYSYSSPNGDSVEVRSDRVDGLTDALMALLRNGI